MLWLGRNSIKCLALKVGHNGSLLIGPLWVTVGRNYPKIPDELAVKRAFKDFGNKRTILEKEVDDSKNNL